MSVKIYMESKEMGISYIEVLLGIAILSFILLVFVQMLFFSFVSTKSNEFRTLAYNWATDRMEELKSLRYNNFVLTPLYPSWSVDGEEELASGIKFYRKLRVSEITSGRLKNIEIKVNWTERNEDKEVLVESYKANYSSE